MSELVIKLGSSIIILYGVFVALSPYMFQGSYYFAQEWTICDYYLPDQVMKSRSMMIVFNVISLVIPAILPAVMTVICNAYIVLHLLQTACKMSKTRCRLSTSCKQYTYRRKVIIRIALMTVSYFTCYLFWIVYYSLVFLDDMGNEYVIEFMTNIRYTEWLVLMTWYSFSVYLNSAIIPIIYCATCEQLKAPLNAFRSRIVKIKSFSK